MSFLLGKKENISSICMSTDGPILKPTNDLWPTHPNINRFNWHFYTLVRSMASHWLIYYFGVHHHHQSALWMACWNILHYPRNQTFTADNIQTIFYLCRSDALRTTRGFENYFVFSISFVTSIFFVFHLPSILICQSFNPWYWSYISCFDNSITLPSVDNVHSITLIGTVFETKVKSNIWRRSSFRNGKYFIQNL